MPAGLSVSLPVFRNMIFKSAASIVIHRVRAQDPCRTGLPVRHAQGVARQQTRAASSPLHARWQLVGPQETSSRDRPRSSRAPLEGSYGHAFGRHEETRSVHPAWQRSKGVDTAQSLDPFHRNKSIHSTMRIPHDGILGSSRHPFIPVSCVLSQRDASGTTPCGAFTAAGSTPLSVLSEQASRQKSLLSTLPQVRACCHLFHRLFCNK